MRVIVKGTTEREEERISNNEYRMMKKEERVDGKGEGRSKKEDIISIDIESLRDNLDVWLLINDFFLDLSLRSG